MVGERVRPQIEAIVKEYLEDAKEYLEGRKWAKAWRLAEAIGVSSARAGQILSYLPEWRLWNPTQKNRKSRLWVRENEPEQTHRA
jgi:hypothetical protein